MEYTFSEIAKRLSSILNQSGIRKFHFVLQYFPTKKSTENPEYIPSEELVKHATNASKVKYDIHRTQSDFFGTGIIAENCCMLPEAIGESVAMCLYADIESVGVIAVFPGDPQMAVSPEPSYCWHETADNSDQIRTQIDKHLKEKAHWHRATGLFYVSDNAL